MSQSGCQLIFTAVVMVGLFMQWHFTRRDNTDDGRAVSNPLDGCLHVYVDLGSNMGVQVRKLYEPHAYPKAKIRSIYQDWFGGTDVRKDKVCAVGFEPNPNHSPILQRLEKSYKDCGFRVKFFTETAVSDMDGESDFYFDSADKAGIGYGSGILGPKEIKRKREKRTKGGKVSTVKLSDFVLNVVAKRRLPHHPKNMTEKPVVLMKMDIEGSETEVLSDMLVSGAMDHIDVVSIEYHWYKAKNAKRKERAKQMEAAINYVSKVSGRFKIVRMDDETYSEVESATQNLPNCTKEEKEHHQ